MGPVLALARADVALFLANRRALLVSLVAPILIAAFFGAVLGGAPKKPSRVPLAVTNLDASAVAAKIVAAMKADETFAIEEAAEPAARARVREGKARAAVVIPPGFGEAAAAGFFRPDGAKPEIAILYDPSQAVTLSLVKGLLAQHAMQAVSSAAFGPEMGPKAIEASRRELAASRTVDEATRRDLGTLFDAVERLQLRERAPGDGQAASGKAMPGFTMPFATKDEAVTSGAGRRYNAYSHAFAGMAVQFILFMGIEAGMALLLMRRQGLWKRLRAAPVSRAALLASRVASGTVIAFGLLLAIYAAAVAVFGVRIEGSAAGFALVGFAFSVLTASFGLLVASLGRTPEATRGIAVVATLLLVMLGGAWVPTFVFPDWLQAATLAVPTRWAIDGLEAATWRGLGFGTALVPAAGLLAAAAACAAIAIARFRWEE